MTWITIKSEDDLPKQYTDVLVVFGERPQLEFKVLRHESGWWYGLPRGVQPVAWYKHGNLSDLLAKAKEDY